MASVELMSLQSFPYHLTFILALVSALILIPPVISTRLYLRRVPGPKISSWVWGEEWNLYTSPVGSLYFEWHNAFGKVVKFTGAFGHQALSITDPRAISFILGESAYDFPKPHGVRAWFKALLGEGIIWVEGKELHEKQRRSLAPALSNQSVRNLMPIFYDCSAKMISQWTRIIDNTDTIETEIEITNWAARFALDTVTLSAFSYDLDCLSGEPHALAEALDGLTNNEHTKSSFYMRALFWMFPSILSVGKKGEMIRKTKKELGDIALSVWKDYKLAGDPRGYDLASFMLRDEKCRGESSSEEQIISQMRTIISAGYETVSAIIAWTLYEISMDPLLQSDLREEVCEARDPSFDHLNTHYPLLDSIIKETLRVHPPILENHHVAARTISVPLSEPLPGTCDTHLIIPRGTILGIPVNVVQADPNIWGPDAAAFRPSRWLELPKQGNHNRRKLLAFSEGPRACFGRVFATAEIKALIMTLIRHFSFTCPYDIEAFQSFVVRPRIRGQGPSSLPLIVRKVVS